MASVPPQSSPPSATPPATDWTGRARKFLSEYAWVIIRNIIGWILILTAPALGVLLPGPGGLPVFLIGFALVTFPGKRRLTARVLRGRRLRLETRFYAIAAAVISILIPGIALWIFAINLRAKDELRHIVEMYAPRKSQWVLTIVLAVAFTWAVTRLSLRILNGLLRLLPKFRRRLRPWLRKQGFNVLPPRHRQPSEPKPEANEIIEIDPRHGARARALWTRSKPWLRRIFAIGITAWILFIMVRPLHERWPQVRGDIAALRPARFIAASAIFAVFLLAFRALSWRRVLKGFGYKLPYGAATRIWATSELARYLPGAIWQVVGRVYLAKPYGVPGSIVSTSQILEICIFLLANVLLSAGCLLWFGQKIDPLARPWLICAMAAVPLLSLLLHPKIFYGVVNRILARLKKPAIVRRLRGRKLIALLFWMMLGLVLQSVAVYLIADPVLHFKPAWWWVVAGSYCLAWCAGFLAFWAPGGIGVREWVFVTTMQFLLPHRVRETFQDPAALHGVLVVLVFLLRLWTVLGELMLAFVAYTWDWRGALGRGDAKGRIGALAIIPQPSMSLEPSQEQATADADMDARSKNTSREEPPPKPQTRTATG